MKKLSKAANIILSDSEDYLTGSWRKDIPIVVDKELVDSNPKIALFCPESAIKFKGGKFSHIDYKYCKGCGICARELPKGIHMKKRV